MPADADVIALRQSFEAGARRLRGAGDVTVETLTTAGLNCDWLTPPAADETAVLCYLHGGGYVMGSRVTHRPMVSHIARAAGVPAAVPDYRLAPEHPFPAALDDCCAVYRQLLVQGLDPARIVIGGDSAGGGLALATLLALRDAGKPLPGALVLLSPWLDLTGTGSRANVDPVFRANGMPRLTRHYCREEQLATPLVSPLLAELGGLPPVLVQVGAHEILLSDATRVADRLSTAGVRVTLQVWPEMWHVFQFFAGRMPEATRAVRDIGAYIRHTIGAPPAAADAAADEPA
ncbi:MAG: alpha/beta hydrolase [Woeseiaceae bacterium]|nr:alpha/beta hydrolase [Woeseiaceae bacterium]